MEQKTFNQKPKPFIPTQQQKPADDPRTEGYKSLLKLVSWFVALAVYVILFVVDSLFIWVLANYVLGFSITVWKAMAGLAIAKTLVGKSFSSVIDSKMTSTTSDNRKA